MVKAVLPVEHIHHAFFDRLYHDHTAVEVTALIHIRYNPIHEGAQEIAFAKLYDSLRSHCLRSRLTIQFTHGYIDLIDLYLFLKLHQDTENLSRIIRPPLQHFPGLSEGDFIGNELVRRTAPLLQITDHGTKIFR